ncbi:MAG: helix-turn-helix domain-containing protein [Ruminococcus sp.]|nr:helix-turn-helix domain-containing protein [Ruminococcus sp.]
MTNTKKNEIIDSIMNLLIQLTNDEETVPTAQPKPVEMLTVKECTEAVKGLKENTVRSLVAQGKVKYIRTGQGKRGKILINKDDLLRVFEA